jgi:hypothetical protein
VGALGAVEHGVVGEQGRVAAGVAAGGGGVGAPDDVEDLQRRTNTSLLIPVTIRAAKPPPGIRSWGLQ